MYPIWPRAHTKFGERGELFRKTNVEGDWVNFPTVTFKAAQSSNMVMVRGATLHLTCPSGLLCLTKLFPKPVRSREKPLRPFFDFRSWGNVVQFWLKLTTLLPPSFTILQSLAIVILMKSWLKLRSPLRTSTGPTVFKPVEKHLD